MRVKHLTLKQLCEMLEHLIESGDKMHYETLEDILDTKLTSIATWHRTPQGHEYWSNIVNNFENRYDDKQTIRRY